MAVGYGLENPIAKILDLIGTANALFLVITSYRRDLMPRYFMARHKAIVSTGLTAIKIPCGWLCKKAFRKVVLEIPIALIGLGGYLTITTLSITNVSPLIILFFAGIGVLASAKLMQIMFGVIKIACPSASYQQEQCVLFFY